MFREQCTLFRIQVLTLFLENTNCLLRGMYDIHVYFVISHNLCILEENVLLINQIIYCCKLDK